MTPAFPEMRSFTLSLLLAALLQFAAISVSVPTVHLPILARNQQCTNAPSTTAGTLLSARSPPRGTITLAESTTQVWCALGTRTYIIVRLVHSLPDPHAVYTLLDSAYQSVLDIIDTLGDGVIRQGYFKYLGSSAAAGLELYLQNSNNHQQTWGVVKGAVHALRMYMEGVEWNRGEVGSVQFSIWDGDNEVGLGTLGPS